MLIVDTGPLVAMLNAKDRHHEACTALFRRFCGPIVVPAPIVTEVAYFLQIEPGPAVEAAFLDALARGELLVEATTPQDFARMADLVRQYAPSSYCLRSDPGSGQLLSTIRAIRIAWERPEADACPASSGPGTRRTPITDRGLPFFAAFEPDPELAE